MAESSYADDYSLLKVEILFRCTKPIKNTLNHSIQNIRNLKTNP